MKRNRNQEIDEREGEKVCGEHTDRTAGPQPYPKSTGGEENKRRGKQGKGSRSNQGHGKGIMNRAKGGEPSWPAR